MSRIKVTKEENRTKDARSKDQGSRTRCLGSRYCNQEEENGTKETRTKEIKFVDSGSRGAGPTTAGRDGPRPWRAGRREAAYGDEDLVDGLPDDLLRLLVHLDEGEGVVVDEPGEEPAGALLAPIDSL